MKEDLAKKEKLVEFRATGKSMDFIAAELHISKSTVAKWIYELNSEIANKRFEEYENILEKYRISKNERLDAYTQLLEKSLQELKNRDISNLSTSDLLKLIESLEIKIRHELKSLNYDTGEVIEPRDPFDVSFGESIPKRLELDY